MVILKNRSKMVLPRKTLKGFDHAFIGTGNRFRLELKTLRSELICRFRDFIIGWCLLNATLSRRTDWFQHRHTAEAQDETEDVTKCLCLKKGKHLFLVLVIEISGKIEAIRYYFT